MLRIGQSQVRFEDDALLRGEERFTDDVAAPDALHMGVARSANAAGRILTLDIEEAAQMLGVSAVLTGRDMEADEVGEFVPRLKHPGADGGDMPVPPFPPLTSDKVRFVGDPVAIVLADSRAMAEIAAEAVLLDVEETPVVTDADAAAEPGAPVVWKHLGSNLCFRVEKGDAAAVKAAFADAEHIVRESTRISRVTASPIEARALIARYEPASDRYRLEIGTQTPHRLIPDLAQALNVAPEKLHVISHACGGGFGMKNVSYPEYVMALWAARRTGRPVRWRAGRMESFISDAHAREQSVEAALALDAEGRFLALDVRIRASLGAYLGPSTPHPPVANLGGLAGVYTTPAIHVRCEGYFTNTQNVAPYRGAGRPEASYILERVIDAAAREIGMDPVELRRRNLIPADRLPYRTPLTFTYDSGDFPAVLEKALIVANWEGLAARREGSRAQNRIRGASLVFPIEIAGGPGANPHAEFARLVAAPDGGVELYVGSSDSGQGHGTAYRQILCDRLGLAPENIRVISGDTDLVPKGTGTFGSRTMPSAGTALWRAANRVIEELAAAAADELEAAAADLVFTRGEWRVSGTDRKIRFVDVLAKAPAAITGEVFASADGATYPNGAHVCEVEIDLETGRLFLERYTVVDDVGVVINPAALKAQICGGVAQGAGQALQEWLRYDPDTGQILSASLMDYALPRAADLPRVTVESHASPTAMNPLGAKGAGEAGTVGALPAVMNAVNDALASVGAQSIDMPATPARIWSALKDARTG